MSPFRAFSLVALALAVPFAAGADAPKKDDAPVSYYREVRPVFQQHCQGCHQPAKPQGGYVMTEHADLLKAGDRAVPNVVPGKPDKSLLVEQITPMHGKKAAEMPKGKDALPKEDLEKIVKWIAQG